MHLPQQRWQIHPPQVQLAAAIAAQMQLSPLLAQVLINRGINTPELAQQFLDPDSEPLPDPKNEFQDLIPSLNRIEKAIRNGEKIAICGDYDVDGMTSTALLIRTFKALGAQADYEIPSRMTEGYGINDRIVRELNHKGVTLLITVDNGIAAYTAIALAEELGTSVIVTDHHDIPAQLPPATAILNPKYKVDPQSPYATIAGVGVAYVLALELADRFDKRAELEDSLLELFTLGTIADLASLTGINRRLVRKGLKILSQSKLMGVIALINESGITRDKQTGLKPEAIGFSLGPRINAVGRIGDPKTVIELLTTAEMGEAIALAQECEAMNRKRQELCAQIEREAIQFVTEAIAAQEIDLHRDKVLVVAKHGWHHGVIGIVASRLVERYGAPTFMCTYEEDGSIRSSVRGIPEFNVFESLEFAKDLLHKHGGHPAAGGFSMPSENLEPLKQRLYEFAQNIDSAAIKPLVKVDVLADLTDISMTLLAEIDRLQPCGMGNADPVFYSHNVRVLSQQRRGKEKVKHLSLELDKGNGEKIKAIAWRWGEYCPVPDYVDLAYKIRANQWQDTTSVELELVGIRTHDSHRSAETFGDRSVEPRSRRSPTPHTLTLEHKTPPPIQFTPQWHPIADLNALVGASNQQPMLLYGYQRPYDRFRRKFQGEIDCDRPYRLYDALVLWSLPPSATHLRWLIALAQPKHIYLNNEIPPILTAAELRQKITTLTDMTNLNLLDLGQQWWVAPCTIVAALRELGHACENFPLTRSLTEEIMRLERWYSCPLPKLAEILHQIKNAV